MLFVCAGNMKQKLEGYITFWVIWVISFCGINTSCFLGSFECCFFFCHLLHMNYYLESVAAVLLRDLQGHLNRVSNFSLGNPWRFRWWSLGRVAFREGGNSAGMGFHKDCSLKLPFPLKELISIVWISGVIVGEFQPPSQENDNLIPKQSSLRT